MLGNRKPALSSKLKLDLVLVSKHTSCAHAARPMALAKRVILAAPAYNSMIQTVGHLATNRYRMPVAPNGQKP